MYSQFRGTGVALVTPFKQGNIDFDALEKIINFNIEGDVDFLVSLGTTGESVTLSKEEKLNVLSFIADITNDRVPLVAGFGGNDTNAVLQTIKGFHFNKYEAILSVSPAYNKPTQQGIIKHFEAIVQEAPKPVILYNVPGRTGSNMTAETTLHLAHSNPKFMAVKEASGDQHQVMQIVKNKPDHFLVLSGDDMITLPMLSFGIDGVISVVANAFPKQFSDMVRYGLDNDFETARQLHFSLMDIINLLFVDGNPPGVKAALEIQGICSKEVRLPLVELPNNTYQKMEAAIATLKSMVPG